LGGRGVTKPAVTVLILDEVLARRQRKEPSPYKA